MGIDGSGSRIDMPSSGGMGLSASSFVGEEGSVREDVGTRHMVGG